jgi:eukaryotic-like serine/threonine-protein kinase
MGARPDSWRLGVNAAFTPELTVLAQLGGGAAYEAYLAFDEVTYTSVVVKAVRPAQVVDEVTLSGLRREAEMLGHLRHPALVRGLRSVTDGDRPHLVLEHLDGPRLSTLVRRHGPLSPQQYLPLAIEVASALHYMHRKGFVHLDVKPGNIIMGAPAKLIDVSLARPVTEAAALTTPVGTDFYMAPEQADPLGRVQNGGAPGPAADIWGLGVTLVEAVTGRRPFDDGDEHAAALPDQWPQLVDAPAPIPDSVPRPVAEVLLACLEPDPARRPAPADVVDELAPLLGELPTGALSGFRDSLRRR